MRRPDQQPAGRWCFSGRRTVDQSTPNLTLSLTLTATLVVPLDEPPTSRCFSAQADVVSLKRAVKRR